jgi:hypothetical protein
VLVQDKCTVLVGDEAQVEAYFDPFGDSANHDAR